MDLPGPRGRKTDSHSISKASSPLTRSCPYDVFLSFRGADPRNSFTGDLYTYLVQKGINTFRSFIDDEGVDLSSSLVQAIQGSKISIVIFSDDYASSRRCLDELVEILECMKLRQQLVWPVFYKVDASDVRHQKGRYGEHLAKHECRFKGNTDKVKRWRTALREASNLSGWTFLNGHEANFISNIAEQISEQVAKRSYLNVAKYPVGIESRVQEVLECLDVGGSDVRMVGIFGLGGIGKTTIAKGLYNSIGHKFEACGFLANVRAASVPHQGLVGLQNDLLDQSSGEWKMNWTDADRGSEEIKARLGSKKVLLVLDDVNELNQLEKLAGGLDWFGRGSRVIITTTDKGLLTSHQVNAIYTAKALNDDEARNLFILNAFKENRNPDEVEKFPIDAALHYAHGLPLAINILGSLLRGQSINQWHATLDNFSRFPNRDIQKVLETSYDELEYPINEAFLDIACFLNGKYEEYVIHALEGSCLNPVHALEVLEEKSLIDRDQFGRIRMHDLLEEMGKEIGRRSRIWFCRDVYHNSPNGRISPSGRPKFVITSWKKGDLIGSGSFGSVYEGISDGGCFIAIKEVSLLDQETLGRQKVTQLEQEIHLLSQFEHENIVQYYGTKKDESKLCIFLELVTRGSLRKLYQTYHLIDLHVSVYTRQILQGLKYLHDRNVIHRDIKCANILVHANGSVKLADFGLAKATRLNDIKSSKGTAHWMAPEVVNCKSQGYGLPADIWSLGCTVLEMLTEQIPYSGLEWMAALFKIGKGVPPLVPDDLSKEAKEFIHLCLQVKPDDRPTAAQLLEHLFVNKPLPPTPSGSVPPYNQHRQS